MIPNTTEREKINNTEEVTAFTAEGGRILHIRPEGKFRGVTFAYVRKGGRVTFSTSVQHRHDHFTKKIGTKLALEHFRNDQVISLPVGNKDSDVVGGFWAVARMMQY